MDQLLGEWSRRFPPVAPPQQPDKKGGALVNWKNALVDGVNYLLRNEEPKRGRVGFFRHRQYVLPVQCVSVSA